jgi:hypothetical protein
MKSRGLFEHLTRIVDGMFCQLPQRDKIPLEFPTPFALAIRSECWHGRTERTLR